MILGTSKKQQNLAKMAWKRHSATRRPSEGILQAKGPPKAAKRTPSWRPKGAKIKQNGTNLSQKWFGRHLKCNAYLYTIFEHIWDPPGRSDSSMSSPPHPPFLDLLDRVKPICFKPRLKPILNNQNQRNSNKSG